MARPADLPPAEHYKHGTRARYVAGCRCDDCRGANRAYYHERQRRAKEAAALIVAPEISVKQKWTTPDGTKKARYYKRACPGVNGEPCPNHSHLRKDSKGGVCGTCRLKLAWNGLVDAAPARRHLEMLSAAGVGRRAVHEASGVSNTVLTDIKTGRKFQIRASTMRDILSVDASAKADHAHVPAKDTWRRIRELKRLGYSKAEMAKELGYKTPALQLRKSSVLAVTEHKVKKLHQSIMGAIAEEKKMPKICTQCGYSHEEFNRLTILRSMLPAKFENIAAARPCFYGNDSGNRRLYRDLHKLKAESENAVWSLPRR